MTRTLKDGMVIGERERVSPCVALKAETAYATSQIKEGETVFKQP